MGSSQISPAASVGDLKDSWATFLMLVLTFGTGVLDAATYLGFHGVFTANMTGNVIFVAVGVLGSSPVSLLRASLALIGFAVGALILGRLGRARRKLRQLDGFVAISLGAICALMLAGFGMLAALPGNGLALELATLLYATAMGAQACIARRVAVADVTTVVVTSTFAALVAENKLTGRTAAGSLTLRRFLAVLSMALGALIGALLVKIDVLSGLGLSCFVVGFATIICTCRIWQRRRSDLQIDKGREDMDASSLENAPDELADAGLDRP